MFLDPAVAGAAGREVGRSPRGGVAGLEPRRITGEGRGGAESLPGGERRGRGQRRGPAGGSGGWEGGGGSGAGRENERKRARSAQSALFRPPEEPKQPRPRRRRLPAGQSREPAPTAMSSSAGSGHQPSQSRAIPTRTVAISDAAQLPHDYCTTPGGTLFSTTPGGTRIIYDRKFLLDRRNSPMAQTPPCHLPNIPGVTSPGTLIEDSKVEVNNLNNLNNHDRKHAVGDDAQFEMDIWLPCKD